MDSPSPPKAPDPKETAAAQTTQNVQTAKANTILGNANEVGPYGSVTYKQIGQTRVGDEFIPQYERTTTLSPQQQAILNQQQQFQIGTGQLANSQVDRLQGVLNQPINAGNLQTDRATGGVSAPQLERMGVNDWSQDRQRVEDALYSRINPQLDRDRAAMESKLANQGIMPGSEAYREAVALADRQANDARMQAILAGGQEQSRLAGLEQSRLGFNNNVGQMGFTNQMDAKNFQNALRDQELAERLRLRNQPINEITALMSGNQVTTPTASPYRGGTIAWTDVAGITQQGFQNQMAGYNQQVAQQNAMLGGIAGGVGSLLALPMTGGGSLGGSMIGGMFGGIGA